MNILPTHGRIGACNTEPEEVKAADSETEMKPLKHAFNLPLGKRGIEGDFQVML